MWYLQITMNYVQQMLPCAILGVVGFFLLRPLRKNRTAARKWALFLFTIFSAGLAALTLFPANFWSHTRLHWPEFSIGEFYWKITICKELSMLGPWGSYMLLGNIVMFTPFGFSPALLSDKPRWWKSLLTGFCVSCFIEFVQLFVGRSSDINDIILNALGALIGYWIYLLLKGIAPGFVAKFKSEGRHGRKTRA